MVILVNLLLLLILANPMIGKSAVSEESVNTVKCDVCGDFVQYCDPGEYGDTGELCDSNESHNPCKFDDSGDFCNSDEIYNSVESGKSGDMLNRLTDGG